MVFYFSGTGNSRFTAERIGQALGLKVVDVAPYVRKQKRPEFTVKEPYVFVCPCYMSAPARVMTYFVENAVFPKKVKAYFVVTCASAIGIAPKVNSELADKKGFEYMGTAKVVMPQNYIALFTTKDKEEVRKVVNEALPEIDKIAETIKANGKIEESKLHFMEYMTTVGVRDLYYKRFMKTRRFHVKDSCISCGKCVRICPLANIKLKDKRPSWGTNCTHCMACINQCPKDAIEYGKGSVGKPRYKGPTVTD